MKFIKIKVCIIFVSNKFVDTVTFVVVDAYGGVMYLLVGSIAEVYYCSFYENDGRYGGGVGYIETSSIVVESSSFLDQSANAGAVFFMVHSQAIIDGSSFTSNGIKAFNGGAIYLSSQSLLTSRSNVFSSNEVKLSLYDYFLTIIIFG